MKLKQTVACTTDRCKKQCRWQSAEITTLRKIVGKKRASYLNIISFLYISIKDNKDNFFHKLTSHLIKQIKMLLKFHK